jgi:hypothetical protein
MYFYKELRTSRRICLNDGAECIIVYPLKLNDLIKWKHLLLLRKIGTYHHLDDAVGAAR